jgi:hypothetical protein
MASFDDISTRSSGLARIEEDDKSLRELPLAGKISLSEDVDDYAEMRTLFLELAEMMRSIKSDPNAIKSPLGGYDVSMLKALNSMIMGCAKIIETVNKMKNSDRLTLAILESHTRSMSANLAIPLGEKIRVALAQLEDGDADGAQRTLLSLVQNDIVAIFREAATQAMLSSREQYQLHS